MTIIYDSCGSDYGLYWEVPTAGVRVGDFLFWNSVHFHGDWS